MLKLNITFRCLNKVLKKPITRYAMYKNRIVVYGQALSWQNPGCIPAMLVVKITIVVVSIFEWSWGGNRKSHAIKSSKFLRKEELSMGRIQRYRRMENQKPGPVCWHVTSILYRRRPEPKLATSVTQTYCRRKAGSK